MHYIVLGVFLIGLLLGSSITHRVTSDSYEADMGRAAREEKKLFDANNERIDQLANELEVARRAKNIEYKTITEYVQTIDDRPPYLLECIDDDGLRAINSVISERPLDPGESTSALRAGDNTEREDRRGADEQAD